MIIVTTDTIAGKTIKETIGLVTSQSVQTKNAFKDFGAGLKSLVGGKLGSYENMINAATTTALQNLKAEAMNVSANAIVGLRFSTTDTLTGASEVIVYGTAVVI